MPHLFSRFEMLVGPEALTKLKNAHVCVLGLGGVGGHATEALVRSGVGTLTLVDHDTVSLTNLNRQIIATQSTLHQKKTDAMEARAKDINPDIRIIKKDLFFSAENIDTLDFDTYDYIIDAIDSVSSKLTLIEEAKKSHTPIISSMGTGNRLDPSKFLITDLSKTSGCPLAKVMRRELRQRGINHHTVLTSTELPLKPAKLPGHGADLRTPPGSVSWVPPCAGMMIAGYIVQKLLARAAEPEPQNKSFLRGQN